MLPGTGGFFNRSSSIVKPLTRYSCRRLLAQRRSADKYALIYVTPHVSSPTKDFEQAIVELRSKTGNPSTESFYWTSWRNLPQILRDVRTLAKSATEAKLLDDLAVILDRQGLTYFRGITCAGWSLGTLPWSFKKSSDIFDWVHFTIPRYEFLPHPTQFEWNLREPLWNVSWRWRDG